MIETPAFGLASIWATHARFAPGRIAVIVALSASISLRWCSLAVKRMVSPV
jgi:hypothetical protein